MFEFLVNLFKPMKSKDTTVTPPASDFHKETSFRNTVREEYIACLVDVARTRINHSINETKTLTTRIKLDMHMLNCSFDGIKPKIYALSPYVVSIRFRTIRDSTYMIVQYRKDENGEYMTRSAAKKKR